MSVALNMEWPSITAKLAGKTVSRIWKDGKGTMLIEFTDGHTARMGWYEGHKKQPGEPRLEGIDIQFSIGMKG